MMYRLYRNKKEVQRLDEDLQVKKDDIQKKISRAGRDWAGNLRVRNQCEQEAYDVHIADIQKLEHEFAAVKEKIRLF